MRTVLPLRSPASQENLESPGSREKRARNSVAAEEASAVAIEVEEVSAAVVVAEAESAVVAAAEEAITEIRDRETRPESSRLPSEPAQLSSE